MEVESNFVSELPQLEESTAIKDNIHNSPSTFLLEPNLKSGNYRNIVPGTPETPLNPGFGQESAPIFDIKSNVTQEDIEISDEQPEHFQKVAIIIEVENQQLSDVEMDTDAEETPTFSVNYFDEKSLVELARYSWRGTTRNQRFLKGCLWSPDGTCALTAVNGDGMHVVELPQDLYASETVNDERPLDVLQSAVHVKEAGVVYDFCWYPFMNSGNPASCGWLASRQHEPIQMWDAFNGTLRCSYRGYNSVDEVESALSITFSSDGTEIIGGYKKSIKIFRTDVPGRDFTAVPIKSPSSALAVNSGNTNYLAVGSWTGIISLYDTRHLQRDVIDQFAGHTGGITFLKFLHGDNYLVSGARKDNKLLMWDIRNSYRPVLELSREVTTNQRIYFDVSEDGKWLASGDTNGLIHAWDISEKTTANGFKFPLHRDCCNGVSIHPSKPILASCSGQHHFPQITEESEDVQQDAGNTTKPLRENCLIFWWCGPTGSKDALSI